MAGTTVSFRMDDESLARVDEVAKLMRMSRSNYLRFVMELWHSENLNPLKTAQAMLEKSAEYADLEPGKEPGKPL